MAKRTRRERRLEGDKPAQARPQTAGTDSAFGEEPLSVASAPEIVPVPVKTAQTAPVSTRKGVNFAREYFYVFSELTTILIITALMFAVIIGLAFVI